MLYREYDPAVLKRLQETELEILRDFDALCEKHGIDYFGIAGTALGAVRHGGFIPWDDDIDIGFTRENYEKFLKVADTEYPGKYKVLNAEIDPNFVLMTSHWGKCGTEYQLKFFENSPVECRIFLDLFCFENVPDDEKLMKKQAFWAWFWGKMLIVSGVPHPVLYFTGIKKHVIHAAVFCAHYFLKIIPKSKQFFYKQAKKHATKYNDQDTERIAFLFHTSMFAFMMKRDTVLPTKRLSFGGLNISFPGEIKNHLCQYFGPDYMTLPPEEKRHNHPPYRLSFGDKEDQKEI